MLALILSVLIASLIISWSDVQFFQNELQKLDQEMLNRLSKLAFTGEVENDFGKMEDVMNEQDILIIKDSNDLVIDSIGIVLNDAIKEMVHDHIQWTDKKIVLQAKEVQLNDYIATVNVKVKDVYRVMVDNGYELYYIPKWRLRAHYLLHRLLRGFSTACFVSALAIALLNKDISKMIEEEKREQ
jgi:hypothetical protein